MLFLNNWIDEPHLWCGLVRTLFHYAGHSSGGSLLLDRCTGASTGGVQYGFNRADGVKAWTIDLPEQPAMNRLALDRAARVPQCRCALPVAFASHLP